MADNMSDLEAAGFPIDRIPEDQRSVLSSLSDEEVRVLTSVKRRLDSATEVEGHMRSDDGYVFW